MAIVSLFKAASPPSPKEKMWSFRGTAREIHGVPLQEQNYPTFKGVYGCDQEPCDIAYIIYPGSCNHKSFILLCCFIGFEHYIPGNPPLFAPPR
jgi:hypothetical protein